MPKHAENKNTQLRSDSAHTRTQPTQLTLLEKLEPTPPLTGQDGPVAHCYTHARTSGG